MTFGTNQILTENKNVSQFTRNFKKNNHRWVGGGKEFFLLEE